MGLDYVINCDYPDCELNELGGFFSFDLNPEPKNLESFLISANDAGYKYRHYYFKSYWLCKEHAKPKYMKAFRPKEVGRDGFYEKYSDTFTATSAIMEILSAIGKSGDVWYSTERKAFRVCGEEYEPLDDESLLGRYTPDVEREKLHDDITEFFVS